MYNNPNYPWYIQSSPVFTKLYDGLFPIVSAASPLELRQMFSVDQVTGAGLLNFGRLWGLRGVWGAQSDGLIYNIDEWSTDKVWTGQMKDLDAKIYRNFIKMKTYINGRQYNLQLIKEAVARLLDGFEYDMWVEEQFMHFIIHISGPSATMNLLYNMAQYDPHFLGKPTGVSYEFIYEMNNQ